MECDENRVFVLAVVTCNKKLLLNDGALKRLCPMKKTMFLVELFDYLSVSFWSLLALSESAL